MSYRENLSTHLLLLMVAAIWGSTWAIGRFLSYGLDDANRASMGPATSAWLRYVFAVFAFAAWCWIYRNKGGPRILPRERKAWKYTFWMALLGTMGYQLLFMNGMKWTAAGDASLIIPVNPVSPYCWPFQCSDRGLVQGWFLGSFSALLGSLQ